jgi:GntR family transcriptional repressor for pyruvate dehydrogenase complex
MGVVVSRRGAGTFIADGPPDLGAEPLSLLASLHRFTPSEMFEARLVLEVGVAGLAARHAGPEHLAAMAEETTEMFASRADPVAFLRHDVRFHRAVAEGCGNRVLAALMEMVAAQFYEQRKDTVEHARDLHDSAEMHRRIFRAIRARDAEAARAAMAEHLEKARQAQDLEARPGGRDDDR